MKAIVYERYGAPDVLHITEVEQPTPQADEVLIKIYATTVNRSDCGFRSAKPFISRFFSGLIRPKQNIPGTELAGEVVGVGSSVTKFRPGDHVFGISAGANAEFVCAAQSAALATKPAGISFEEAAAVSDGGIIALTCLRRAKLEAGNDILIYGASGSIGTAAVQLAKSFGARVTAVCNTKNVEMVRGLGADEVVDYTESDFTATDRTYDVVFDAVGKTSFRRCRHMLSKGGVYIDTDLGFLWHVPVLALATRWIGSKRVTLPIPSYTLEKVDFLKEQVETGKFRAVIDRCYPLEEAVAATKYVETAQKSGNVVLTVAHAAESAQTSSPAWATTRPS